MILTKLLSRKLLKPTSKMLKLPKLAKKGTFYRLFTSTTKDSTKDSTKDPPKKPTEFENLEKTIISKDSLKAISVNKLLTLSEGYESNTKALQNGPNMYRSLLSLFVNIAHLGIYIAVFFMFEKWMLKGGLPESSSFDYVETKPVPEDEIADEEFCDMPFF